MANYIRAYQSTSSLPYLDKEWLFINPRNIIQSSIFGNVIYDNLSLQDKLRVDFPYVVKVTGAYPRFNISDSVYKICRNELNILPTGRTTKSITEITDNRAMELLTKSTSYERVYVFYSGGLDSATILSSIIKNWSVTDLDKLYVVMNSHSITEYPYFYEMFIKDKLKTIDTSLFFSGKVKLTEHNLYVTGDCGGSLFSPDDIRLYDSRFPKTYNLAWKSNKDNILSYFEYDRSEEIFEKIESSIPEHLTTVYEFLWWCSFNQGYDIDLYYLITLCCLLDETVNTRDFLLNNQYIWFNHIDYQNWAMYSPYEMRVGDTVNLVKLPLRQYIFDFTGDLDYYNNKQIEFSVSKNRELFTRLPIGIDSEYNIYYRDILNK